MRVSSLETTAEALLADATAPDWQVVHETRPCLPLKERSFPFAGLQNGGRMALLDSRTLLLTVGDHEFDGKYAERVLPLETDNDYGKTLRISLDDGRVELFTIGHRNPQGLSVTADGEVWLTEHGPAGGDELNALVPGGNYGWPLHTYGVDYEEGSRPLQEPDHAALGILSPVPRVAAIDRHFQPDRRTRLTVRALEGRPAHWLIARPDSVPRASVCRLNCLHRAHGGGGEGSGHPRRPRRPHSALDRQHEDCLASADDRGHRLAAPWPLRFLPRRRRRSRRGAGSG